MAELTDREKELISFITKLINLATIWGMYEDQAKKLRSWAYDAMNQAGVNTDWQNEMLHTLENDYGIKYTKLDKDTHEPIEEPKVE